MQRVGMLPAHKRILALGAIMASVTLAVIGIAIIFLYSATFELHRARLTALVKSHARIIEAVARYDQIHSPDYPGGPGEATISQLADYYGRFEYMGKTDELSFARRVGDQIVYLLPLRHHGKWHPFPSSPPLSIGFDNGHGAPMRLALQGKSGTVIGLDYRGVMVLAAHEPVAVLDIGIVAKIDLAEVRAIFIKSALLAGGLAVIFAAAGIILFFRITDPLVLQLQESDGIHKRDLIIKDQLAALERANKELRQFTYVASHDLQEPLRMISSYVELLGSRYQDKLDQDANEFIRFATEGAARMKNIIHDLLDLSRIDSKPQVWAPVNVNQTVRIALANLDQAIKETGAMVDVGELPLMTADGGWLTQVFQNLIGNAIKYRHQDRQPEIHVKAALEGPDWLFSISDNGIGFERQYFERVFAPFQRLHSQQKYQGTGIGLAICKKIVERHGGRIWVDSEPGVGSTFWFSLPVKQKDQVP